MKKNPNNCETCDYKRMLYDGKDRYHCYMFASAPTERCMQHKTEQLIFGTPVQPIPEIFKDSVDTLLAGGDVGAAMDRLLGKLRERNAEVPKQPVRQKPNLRIVK